MDEGAGIPAHRASRQVAASLRELDVRPSRGRGQNFLTSTSVVQRIVDLTEATIEDTIVEVGPGLGALTSALADRAGRVVAIEIDQRLADHLVTSMPSPNLTIVCGDALSLPEATFVPADGQYLVAANLPYSTGAAIVRRFLELERPPRRMVVMLQKRLLNGWRQSLPTCRCWGSPSRSTPDQRLHFTCLHLRSNPVRRWIRVCCYWNCTRHPF